MSGRRRVAITVLCEDAQHEAFARSFCDKALGRSVRDLRVNKSPKGRGSGAGFVLKQFPKLLAQYRGFHAGVALIVIVDGDTAGVRARMKQFDEECEEGDVPARQPDDPAYVFVPARAIETWLAYLDGEPVDEARKYPHVGLHKARECAPYVDKLLDMCRQNALRQPAPMSLTAACEEYERLKSRFP